MTAFLYESWQNILCERALTLRMRNGIYKLKYNKRKGFTLCFDVAKRLVDVLHNKINEKSWQGLKFQLCNIYFNYTNYISNLFPSLCFRF